MAERARNLFAGVLLAALAGACSTSAAANVDKPSSAGASGPAASAAAPAGETPGGVPSCGSGKAECPMQRWMKANLQTFQRSHDHARLAEAFEQLAKVEPKGFDGWEDSARQGAEAAAKGDEAGVSRSCETCHRAHRDTYRRTLRAQALL